jgi:hypothetical protein
MPCKSTMRAKGGGDLMFIYHGWCLAGVMTIASRLSFSLALSQRWTKRGDLFDFSDRSAQTATATFVSEYCGYSLFQ